MPTDTEVEALILCRIGNSQVTESSEAGDYIIRLAELITEERANAANRLGAAALYAQAADELAALDD